MTLEATVENFTKNGTQEAKLSLFREIYDTYFKLVWFCAYRYLGDKSDTDEISDDVFVNFYNRLGTTDIKNIKYYLTRSARNLALNRLRDRKPTEELDENICGTYCFDEGSEIIAEIKKLTSAEEFELLSKHILEGYSLAEIAEKEGSSVNTVKSKYRRLVKKLKSQLGGFYDE